MSNEAVIPLPAREPLNAPDAPRGAGFSFWAVAAVVLLFAFLVSSTRARNSDVWFHLASGRLLAQGEYHFGADPFSFTTGDRTWVNHSWLADLLFFGLFSAGGGAGLAVFKGLTVAGLAALLLSVRRRGSRLTIPAACLLLAVVTMAPRLAPLQPVFLSYFFLGLTLWLIKRAVESEPDPAGTSPATRIRRFAPLLVLFAVWANVDVWFWLGPLLVALLWLGDWLQRRQTTVATSGLACQPASKTARGYGRRLPVWLAPAGLLVCLLNPHGFRVFALPQELSPVLAEAGLTADVRFRSALLSPWQIGVRFWPVEAISLAEWAYFVLLALGLVSFLLEGRRARGGRLAAWVVFALLGAWQVRTVPFFAVVAAPLTALNLQDWLARRAASAGRRHRTLGTFALLAAGLALILLACLGWLRGFYQEGREAAWGLWEDSSLRRTAETIRQWREQKLLTDDDRAFCFHPDVADYLAWFCPGERSVLDHRFTLNPQATRDFEGVCRALNPVLAPREARPIRLPDGWQAVFRTHGVSYLILHDPDQRLLLPGVTRLVQDREQWELLSVEGQAVLFGWRDAARGPAGNAFSGLRFNPERLVFNAPVGEAEALSSAPTRGSGRPPRARQLWERPFRPAPPPPWESSAARVLLQVFADRQSVDNERARVRGWAVVAGGLAGTAARPAPGTALAADLSLRVRMPALFAGLYPRSPALPLLAVRASRRALADHPDDLNACLQLGRAYQLLQQTTLEQPRNDGGTLLGMLRHIQTASALEQAVRVDPDFGPAHALLAEMYERRNFLDTALEHRQAQLRLARSAGVAGGPELEELEDRVQRVEREVLDRENKLVVRARGLGNNPLARAEIAVELGLAKQALDGVLLQSRELLFGTRGAKLQLELMLMLGRATEAGELLLSDEVTAGAAKLGSAGFVVQGPAGGRFGMPVYPWLVICQAAAAGDYGPAADMLDEVLVFLENEEQASLRRHRVRLSVALATEVGLQAPGDSLASSLARRARQEQSGFAAEAQVQRAGRAELHAVAALLALEWGDATAARLRFREALLLSAPAGGHTAALARSYLPYFNESRDR